MCHVRIKHAAGAERHLRGMTHGIAAYWSRRLQQRRRVITGRLYSARCSKSTPRLRCILVLMMGFELPALCRASSPCAHLTRYPNARTMYFHRSRLFATTDSASCRRKCRRQRKRHVRRTHCLLMIHRLHSGAGCGMSLSRPRRCATRSSIRH